jgi:hypothetical protein
MQRRNVMNRIAFVAVELLAVVVSFGIVSPSVLYAKDKLLRHPTEVEIALGVKEVRELSPQDFAEKRTRRGPGQPPLPSLQELSAKYVRMAEGSPNDPQGEYILRRIAAGFAYDDVERGRAEQIVRTIILRFAPAEGKDDPDEQVKYGEEWMKKAKAARASDRRDMMLNALECYMRAGDSTNWKTKLLAEKRIGEIFSEERVKAKDKANNPSRPAPSRQNRRNANPF